jgi:hypothetical protein
MCDYSLMMIPNRLAIEGEELVAHKFDSSEEFMGKLRLGQLAK